MRTAAAFLIRLQVAGRWGRS